MRTRRRSRQSGRLSTTSRRTSSSGAPAGKPARLATLIEQLSGERLDKAFTHPSWASDRSDSYERLEFLGDSVLELAVARALYDRYPDLSEGRLAKIRSHVVSRTSCAVVARELDLGPRLIEKGSGIVPEDELERLSRNGNVLAALLEAVLAALYLEHGYEEIEGPIVEAYAGRIEYAATTHVDFKTELQEQLAAMGRQVSYSVLDVEGPPHNRKFTSAAIIDGDEAGVGVGPSKKAAEQEAARQALEKIRS
jgi:ribonuclease III